MRMNRIDSLHQVSRKFLSEHAATSGSVSQTLCFLSLDICLVVGFIYYFKITVANPEYWSNAPNHFDIWLLL